MTTTDRRPQLLARSPSATVGRPSDEPDSLLPAGYDAVGPPGEKRPRARPSRAVRRRRRQVAAVLPLLVVLYFTWSVLGALSTPGNQNFSAKWADWLRGHHAAAIVNATEIWYYNHHKPPAGGQPKHLNALPAPSPVTTLGGRGTTGSHHTKTHHPVIHKVPTHLAEPTSVPLVVSPALPGEGVWQPVGPIVGGVPGMFEAQFRADDVYTREITTAVWIDPKLLHLALNPGLTEPGGTWSIPPYIPSSAFPTIEAAFNGGFRFQDAHGGFYLDGRTAVPLVQGAASLVFYQDGTVDVGAWGSEVGMTPQVVGVLQNLVPMVDNGQISPVATYDDKSVWGTTLGSATVVARSGVGVTKDGALVYVAGPALTAKTLAESLQRAGAVRAMTLDINPEWVTFNFYSHPNPTDPSQLSPSSLYPQMQRPADRYLGPTEESRDFITVSLASAATS